MTVSGPTRFLPGFVASGDLSSSQYRLVKAASTAGAVILAAAKTDKVLGVLYNEPTSGQAAEIAFDGIVKAQGQASLSVGDYVASDSTGRCQATTTGNDDVFGIVISLDGGSSAGDIYRIMVSRFNY